MTSPSIEFGADVFQGDVLVQRQRYVVRGARREWSVAETGTFPAHPGVEAWCDFTVDPSGFRSLAMGLRGRPETETRVSRETDGRLRVAREESARLVSPESGPPGPFLLAGPNPLFEYVSACLLLGLGRETPVELPVHGIDWRTGQLETSVRRFEWRGDEVVIGAPARTGEDSVILLGAGDLTMREHRGAGQRHVFRTMGEGPSWIAS